MADIIIKTENLCFEYDENDGVKKHPVLRSMNLEIERGSFTAILGHNGSGKSTLAKIISMITLLSSDGWKVPKGPNENHLVAPFTLMPKSLTAINIPILIEYKNHSNFAI